MATSWILQARKRKRHDDIIINRMKKRFSCIIR